jgi:hypothetical protein
MHTTSRLLAIILVFSALAGTYAQNPQRNPNRPRRNPTNPTVPQTGGAQQGGGFGRAGGFGPTTHQAPRPYEDVITKEAKTHNGVFKVHEIGERILFEVPKNMLGRDLMMSVQVIRTPSGTQGMLAPGMPLSQIVIRFEKRKDMLIMRAPQYDVRVSKDAGLTYGLARAAVEPILNAFDVMAYAPDGAAVIDVTRLYNSDAGAFAVSAQLGSGIDPSRSFVERVDAYPSNIEVESQLTFASGGGGGGFGRGGGGGGGGGNRNGATAVVHYSLLALPETPMRARLKDSRIGYFSTFFTKYDGQKYSEEHIGYIDRFRLEKKDPSAAVSDPVKPIVFYIQRDVPDLWRPYIHKAVEAWQPAFEAAGFSNAIIAKDEPTPEQDPDFHAGDLRHNLISWAPSTTENAEGLHIADPRSGETLHAHVVLWNDVLKLAQNWYFVQASPNDPNAQKLPIPDELMGRIMTYIVTHEVGHCLGLEHNFKASSSYSIAELRNPAFTNKWGDEASVMDYGRFNYIAQPGDGARLIPKLGPYDFFAIKYGYMPAIGPSTAAEKPYLDDYLAQQVNNPKVRFGNSDRNDPGMESEDIGNDPIMATTLGLKNLDRVMGYVMPATVKYGEDYSDLNDEYRQILNQRMLELNHVARLVGGVYDTDYHAGRGNTVYTTVSKAEQRAAVNLLITKGLNLPANYTNPAILNRIQSDGYDDLAAAGQQTVLLTLLAESRVARMIDNEEENGSKAYTVADLVGDVQGSIWTEVRENHPVVSMARRGLQLRYLEVMDQRLVGAGGSKSQFRAIARDDLRNLLSALNSKIGSTHDSATRIHFVDCRDRIKEILANKDNATGGTGAAAGFVLGLNQMGFEGEEFYIEGVTDQPWYAAAKAAREN